MTFKFWVTLDFFRRHGKRQIKHFDFGVEYKPNGRTCKFQYHWLEIFGHLEEIYIEASVVFLKYFSIVLNISAIKVGPIHINTFICNIFSKVDRNHTLPKIVWTVVSTNFMFYKGSLCKMCCYVRYTTPKGKTKATLTLVVVIHDRLKRFSSNEKHVMKLLFICMHEKF